MAPSESGAETKHLVILHIGIRHNHYIIDVVSFPDVHTGCSIVTIRLLLTPILCAV